MSPALPAIQQHADRIYDELVLTLKELDRRRHQVLDFKHRVLDRPQILGWVAVGVLGGGLLIAGGATLARRLRRAQLLKERVHGLRRAWAHPERIARGQRAAPLGSEVGKRLALAFITALAQPLARRAATNLMSRPPRT